MTLGIACLCAGGLLALGLAWAACIVGTRADWRR